MSRKSKALEFTDEEYTISITGRHVAVTDSMKDYAMEKLAKLERYGHRIIEVNVIMDIQKLEQQVEIIIKVDQRKFTAVAHGTDMYFSIDRAIEKIQNQLLRYKTRLHDHHLQSRKKNAVKAEEVRKAAQQERELDEATTLNGEEFTQHIIAREDSRPLKMLSYDEAIALMESSEDQCLLFKHQEDPQLRTKAIYRMKDGNYGIIEAQS